MSAEDIGSYLESKDVKTLEKLKLKLDSEITNEIEEVEYKSSVLEKDLEGLESKLNTNKQKLTTSSSTDDIGR